MADTPFKVLKKLNAQPSQQQIPVVYQLLLDERRKAKRPNYAGV